MQRKRDRDMRAEQRKLVGCRVRDNLTGETAVVLRVGQFRTHGQKVVYYVRRLEEGHSSYQRCEIMLERDAMRRFAYSHAPQMSDPQG